MSCKSGLSVILIAVSLALLLIVQPVSADNATTTNVTPEVTDTITETTTEATPVTTVLTTQPAANTTAETTITTMETTSAAPATTVTATPQITTVAVTRLTTIVTLATTIISRTETAAIGSINVHSSPAGASILIDGVYGGTTPRTVTGVPAGNHILRLSLSGYSDYEGSIYVVPGQTAQGYGTVQPVGGVMAASPAPTAVVTVIVPVVAVTPEPAEDTGLLGNPAVIAAIIGAIGVIIISATKVFTHVRPPRKE